MSELFKEYITKADLMACNKLNRPMMKNVDWSQYNVRTDKARILTDHYDDEFWIRSEESENTWLSNHARIVDFKETRRLGKYVTSRFPNWDRSVGYTTITFSLNGRIKTMKTQALLKKYFLPDICWDTLHDLNKSDYKIEIHHGLKMRSNHYDLQFIEWTDYMLPIYKRYHNHIEHYHFHVQYRVRSNSDKWKSTTIKYAPADLGIRPLDFYEMLLTKPDKEKELHDYYQRKFVDRDGKAIEVEFIFFKADEVEFDLEWFAEHRKDPIYYID